MPTNNSSKSAIAITPAVRIGFDCRASLWGTLGVFEYDGTVGPADFKVGCARGRISVGGASSRVVQTSEVPSSRQNLNESSLYFRSHLGQRFISSSLLALFRGRAETTSHGLAIAPVASTTTSFD